MCAAPLLLLIQKYFVRFLTQRNCPRQPQRAVPVYSWPLEKSAVVVDRIRCSVLGGSVEFCWETISLGL